MTLNESYASARRLSRTWQNRTQATEYQRRELCCRLTEFISVNGDITIDQVCALAAVPDDHG